MVGRIYNNDKAMPRRFLPLARDFQVIGPSIVVPVSPLNGAALLTKPKKASTRPSKSALSVPPLNPHSISRSIRSHLSGP